MTSPDSNLETLSMEIKELSLRRQQLLERKKILCIFQELRKRTESGQTVEAKNNQAEIDHIDNKLKEVSRREAELQKYYDTTLSAKENRNSIKPEIDHIDNKLKEASRREAELQKDYDTTLSAKENRNSIKQAGVGSSRPFSGVNVVFVEAPPTIPAPSVILDVKNLPSYPSRTQCPECQQFIMTETFSSVSSLTWLVCFGTAMMGCVAGCCLIPFCLERFKSITHRCPKCRSPIITIKKL